MSDGRTKAELLEEAQALDVEGRSNMSKDELVEAIAAAKAEAAPDTLDDEAGAPDAEGGDDGGTDGDAVAAAPADPEPLVADQSNFVGVSPEYMTTPIVGEPDDIAKRVQKYTEEMAQPAPGTQSFADWAKGRRT